MPNRSNQQYRSGGQQQERYRPAGQEYWQDQPASGRRGSWSRPSDFDPGGTYEDRQDARFDPRGDRLYSEGPDDGRRSRSYGTRLHSEEGGDYIANREGDYEESGYGISAGYSGSPAYGQGSQGAGPLGGGDFASPGFQPQRASAWGGQRYRGSGDDPRGRYESSRVNDPDRYGGMSGPFQGSRYGAYGDFGSIERQHSGRRGPKGWQRSDERIKEDVSEQLYHHVEIDSSEVTVEVADGKVTLEGTVDDRRMKHAIEDIVDDCPGVKDIDNRIRVERNRSETGPGHQELSASSRQEPSSGSTSSAARRKE